jgi:hypothetical protein
LETPIALTLPLAKMSSICFQVCAWSHSQSMFLDPSGLVGNSLAVPFSTVRTGQWTR